MRSGPSRLVAGLVAGMLLAASASAQAGGTDLALDLAQPGEIKLDGVLKEWGALTRLGYENQGSASGVQMQGALAYDETNLYVAGAVTDRTFVRSRAYRADEDHAELVLTFPDASGEYRTLYEVGLYAGEPGKTAGQVKAAGLGVVGTAKIIEAPAPQGYTFEAQIPWSLFPPAARTRVALRGALRYYNSNGSGISAVLSTADKGSASSMPWMLMASEQSLREGMLKQKGLGFSPSRDLVVDVSGDAMNERVLLFDRYLVVLGPHYRSGTEYFWNDFGVSSTDLPWFQVKDVTGDGKAEILVRKRFTQGSGWREMLQVLAFKSATGTLETLFEHETGLSSPTGTIQNEVELVPGARGSALRVSIGTASGYSASNYREPTDTAREALLLPWGTVRSRTYAWDGTGFKKNAEESKPADQPGTSASSSSGTGPERAVVAPPPPRPPSPDELQDQVFALYKREHNIPASLQPSFDFVTNVAEDSRPERVVCHGRDLVVFGKGFKQGLGYVSLSMPQFARPSDIIDVTARDLTGDGRADIIVRGLQRTPAPTELGQGELKREVFFVYTVTGQGLSRLFASETGLSLGDKRLQSTLGFVAGRSGLDIEIRPGRALGWDRQSWPYKQDTEAVSGVEPLVLPWTTQPVRYRFDGSRFVRSAARD